MHSASGTARVSQRQLSHARAAFREATMQAHHRRSLWPGAQTTSMLPGFVPDETTTIGEAPLTKPKSGSTRANKRGSPTRPAAGLCLAAAGAPEPGARRDRLLRRTGGARRARALPRDDADQKTSEARRQCRWCVRLAAETAATGHRAADGRRSHPRRPRRFGSSQRRRRGSDHRLLRRDERPGVGTTRRHDEAAPARTTAVAAPLRGPRLAPLGAARADAGAEVGRPLW